MQEKENHPTDLRGIKALHDGRLKEAAYMLDWALWKARDERTDEGRAFYRSISDQLRSRITSLEERMRMLYPPPPPDTGIPGRNRPCGCVLCECEGRCRGCGALVCREHERHPVLGNGNGSDESPAIRSARLEGRIETWARILDEDWHVTLPPLPGVSRYLIEAIVRAVATQMMRQARVRLTDRDS